MIEWLEQNQALLLWVSVLSAVTFVVSLALIPFLVARIPADYFTHRCRVHDYRRDRHPLVHRTLVVSKNLLGYVLVLAGIVMLVLPGQGILTIAIGVMLVDFPGKYAVEKRLVERPAVIGAINWLRRRAGRVPLEMPLDGD